MYHFQNIYLRSVSTSIRHKASEGTNFIFSKVLLNCEVFLYKVIRVCLYVNYTNDKYFSVARSAL